MAILKGVIALQKYVHITPVILACVIYMHVTWVSSQKYSCDTIVPHLQNNFGLPLRNTLKLISKILKNSTWAQFRHKTLKLDNSERITGPPGFFGISIKIFHFRLFFFLQFKKEHHSVEI